MARIGWLPTSPKAGQGHPLAVAVTTSAGSTPVEQAAKRMKSASPHGWHSSAPTPRRHENPTARPNANPRRLKPYMPPTSVCSSVVSLLGQAFHVLLELSKRSSLEDVGLGCKLSQHTRAPLVCTMNAPGHPGENHQQVTPA